MDRVPKYGMRNSWKMVIGVVVFVAIPIYTLHAAGVEVSPSKLDVTVAKRAVTSRLLVKNPTSDVQMFEVSFDADISNVKINPTSFTLEAGSQQEVHIMVAPGVSKSISSNVSVVARPLKAVGVDVGGGVRVPVSITYTDGGIWYHNLWYWIFLAAGLLIVGLAVLYHRRRNR